ncbi:Cytochrome c [compost metagenome]
MDSHLRELLDLLVRWVHLIAGIMWVGNSMLFNWLDRVLVKEPGDDKNLVGRMWMVHSGGFYDVKKLNLEPGQLPEELHWFKWQNFTTWASGILLLVIVYYLGGAAYMVDTNVANLSYGAAVAVGVGSLVISWLFYDTLWRSPLGKKTPVAAAISFAFLAGLIYALCHLLPGRAAFIHVGVILGTLMTGNVWMHIIPSQKELVSATQEGREQDLAIGYRAKQRSIHNNYMTFPVLFTMISNHFSSLYAGPYNWVILMAVMLSSAGVRHFMNIRYNTPTRGWAPPLGATAAAGVLALAFFFFAKPGTQVATSTAAHPPVAFAEVHPVITQRCATCHSAKPTDATFPSAPAGLALDTPEQIHASAERIGNATLSNYMPLGNKTGMTPAERELVGAWVKQGAKLQ